MKILTFLSELLLAPAQLRLLRKSSISINVYMLNLFLVGVTVRSRADYKNLKVAISVDSMENVSLNEYLFIRVLNFN